MDRNDIGPVSGGSRNLTTGELMSQVVDRTRELVREEIALAKVEAKEQIRSTVSMASALAVGAACGIFGVMVLIAAAVLGIATGTPAWLAALVVGIALLVVAAIAAAVGWSRRVRVPLERTRRTAQEDIRWVKDRMS
jgi:membrane protein